MSTLDMDELEYLVRRILDAYPQERRWPSNIIDEVFKIIEDSRYVYLPQYRRMVGEKGEHRYAVNPQIGKLVKAYTGLETIVEGVPAKLSTLIETYTELGEL